ncbi:hypothetical protein KJY73_16720 [Bowmanella sp. Y26]|uniref:dioxygenase family protein n=1 Tax=Bowmanella yangjiangensis TaxID=2811230 RepID=UPI001BDD31FB|nr:hypothetical protein [Bowmanella yangjiangensis]MBT1065236.1 hypothetical protein [Bowmanella yangjiangensis]
MKLPKVVLLYTFTFVAVTSVAGKSFAQADPFWLKSWNEAQQTRPEVISAKGRIAAEDEPGTPFVIHGRVFTPDGRTPAPGVVVHSYHRDQRGYDFGSEDNPLTTWRLQGWAKTDAQGRFEFQTIRPAADYMGREGAHIHFTLESPDFGRQWAPTTYFLNDPLVPETRIRQSSAAGDFGWVREVVTVDNVQQISVNIRLKDKADF